MSNVSLIDGHVDENNTPLLRGKDVLKHKNNQVDIHKIIDDAMEKKDRTVTIFITDSTTSISVSPLESGRPGWIHLNGTGPYEYEYACPECGQRADYPTPYCPTCGEALSAHVHEEETK